jgi:uncharacterized metal-binding protein
MKIQCVEGDENRAKIHHYLSGAIVSVVFMILLLFSVEV